MAAESTVVLHDRNLAFNSHAAQNYKYVFEPRRFLFLISEKLHWKLDVTKLHWNKVDHYKNAYSNIVKIHHQKLKVLVIFILMLRK